jgi:hypothetical protein
MARARDIANIINSGAFLTPASASATYLPQSSPVIGFKNKIINGDFRIWQRGTSFSGLTANAYTADRWFYIASGATASFTRQNFTPADITAIGYGDAEYFLRMDVTTGDNNTSIQQRIEDVRTLANQQVTVSFWAKGTNPNNGQLQMRWIQAFGSGGSSNVETTIDNFSITGTWTRYSFTFTSPSVSGKTISSTSYVSFDLRQPSTDTSVNAWELDLWGVQIEPGPIATPFKLSGGGSKGTELQLCQRYFIKSQYYNQSTSTSGLMGNYPGVNVGAGTWIWGFVDFPTTMRSAPSVTTSDHDGVIGKLSIWTSVAGARTGNITPYTIYVSQDGFNFSDYSNAKSGVFISGYIAEVEL